MGAPNAETYTDNKDGTVTDNVTGLMWQQAFVMGYAQTDASTYCQNTLRAGNHSDWRLPSLIELVSIVDYGLSSPSINSVFMAMPTGRYWSSSLGSGSTYAGVDFQDGETFNYAGANMINVRCVR